MRLLFSVTPAFGHLFPVVPLARAALDRGHRVGVLTCSGMAEVVARELPGADLLPAGTMPLEFSLLAQERTGVDVMQPTPEVIGEIFGGARLETAIDDAVAAAREWRPDTVIAEAFDTVGPAVAATLEVPWHQIGLGPALPEPIVAEITGAAAKRYSDRGLVPAAPRCYIDPCPPAVQGPDLRSDVRRLPMRPEPHSTPGSVWEPPAGQPGQPRVLVTLGTIFSDRALLDEVVGAVASTGATVIATVGMAMKEETTAAPPVTHPESVHFVQFAPMDQLLSGVDLVVSAGGAGTVLAAMSRAVPLVLWPQGADQPINAARAQAAGVASVVDTAAALPGAVTEALQDTALRAAAATAAHQIAALPVPAEVLDEIVALSTAAD
ncbi:glycosyltransferase family 1 protein [Nocardia speluncae]|uniref:Glycosyltransferase family 1 protein n=1 Tax=Nocardia speluncae TaxID=419477 RepID=A0A846XTE9_9NOCA|nr:glycosyltransferase [Nocardia speluncae]NKY36834.1 glycosyltransferase family 1 protein [Nocardia speluncae]